MNNLLAMPLFTLNNDAQYDVGQGYPSHIILKLTGELIEKIKVSQKCIHKYNLDSVHIEINAIGSYIAVDIEREYFADNNVLGAKSFTTISPNDFDELVTIDLLTGTLDQLNYLDHVRVYPPHVVVGKKGFWVELTHNSPSVQDRFISASKDIDTLSAIVGV